MDISEDFIKFLQEIISGDPVVVECEQRIKLLINELEVTGLLGEGYIIWLN